MSAHQGKTCDPFMVESRVCLNGAPSFGGMTIQAADPFRERAMGEGSGTLCRKARPPKKSRSEEYPQGWDREGSAATHHPPPPWQAVHVSSNGRYRIIPCPSGPSTD